MTPDFPCRICPLKFQLAGQDIAKGALSSNTSTQQVELPRYIPYISTPVLISSVWILQLLGLESLLPYLVQLNLITALQRPLSEIYGVSFYKGVVPAASQGVCFDVYISFYGSTFAPVSMLPLCLRFLHVYTSAPMLVSLPPLFPCLCSMHALSLCLRCPCVCAYVSHEPANTRTCKITCKKPFIQDRCKVSRYKSMAKVCMHKILTFFPF